MGANKGMLSYELRSADVGPTFVGQSILEESSTRKHKLGARLVLGERVFRYCENGALALVAGELVQTAAPVAHHLNCSVPVTAVGSYQITVTPGATLGAKNAYQNGFLHVNNADGQGQTLRIKSHPAIVASTAFVVTLYDQLVVALTASSKVTLTKNTYKDVVVTPTTLTGKVVGVPLIAVTADYFAWLQTKGPCAVLGVGTVVIGNDVSASATTTGAATPLATDSILSPIGQVLQVNATTDYSLIDLDLE